MSLIRTRDNDVTTLAVFVFELVSLCAGLLFEDSGVHDRDDAGGPNTA